MSRLGRLYEPYPGWSDVAFYAFGRRVRRREDGLTAQWFVSDVGPGPVSLVSAERRLLSQVDLGEGSLALWANLIGSVRPEPPYRAHRFVRVGDGIDYLLKDEVIVLEERDLGASIAVHEPGRLWYVRMWERDLLVPR